MGRRDGSGSHFEKVVLSICSTNAAGRVSPTITAKATGKRSRFYNYYVRVAEKFRAEVNSHLARIARRNRHVESLCESAGLDNAALQDSQEAGAVFKYRDVGNDIAIYDQDVGELA